MNRHVTLFPRCVLHDGALRLAVIANAGTLGLRHAGYR